jgi:hypothetical protein
MAVASDESIEVVALPKCARPANDFVGRLCRKGLPTMNDLRQCTPGIGRDQHMQVIRHDCPGMQGISLPIEVKKVLLNSLCDVCPHKPTHACPFVEKGLYAGLKVNHRSFSRKVSEFLFPFIQLYLRK